MFECEGVVRGQGEGFLCLKEYVVEKGFRTKCWVAWVVNCFGPKPCKLHIVAFDEQLGEGGGGVCVLIVVGYRPTLEQVASSHILAGQEPTKRP